MGVALGQSTTPKQPRGHSRPASLAMGFNLLPGSKEQEAAPTCSVGGGRSDVSAGFQNETKHSVLFSSDQIATKRVKTNGAKKASSNK